MNRIDKERIWVFSPVNNIAFKAVIKGEIVEDQLIKAIIHTVNHYEMLNQKVILDNEGIAYFCKAENPKLVIEPMNCDWKELVREQQKIPFAIDKGELIRFFYQYTQSGILLMIIVHHIAGDGLSFTYLLQDIIKSLSGIQLEYNEISLFDMESLPTDSRLKFPMTWLLRTMNKKWKKSGIIFGFDDYLNMHNKYWSSNETFIDTYDIENEDYDNICKFSKLNSLTINTLITTALIRASDELSDVGLAASFRENGNTSMGGYATGISIKYKYNKKKDFVWNCKKVQKLIYGKLNNPVKKFFLLQFMSNIEPTLIDAIYFNACSDYYNKTAESFSKMFGYNGNPKGISITNLTKLPIEYKYGAYEITDFVFIPPLVLNAKRIIGIVTIKKKMTLSLHLNDDAKTEEHREFFYKGVDYLKNL